MKTVLSLFAVMLLAGCTTMAMPGSHSWSYNPQSYAGCTVGVYETEEMTATWHDCKNKASVDSVVDLNSDGEPDLQYSASDVSASEVMAIRADVEKKLAEEYGLEAAGKAAAEITDLMLGL